MEWLRESVTLGLDAQEIKERFLAGLQQFQGTIPPTDDQTLLILQQEECAVNSAAAPPADAPLVQVP